ncbi:hypothetical protein N6P31_22115 [Pectobacterium betavasculorum]|uniref:hypothetical protein n=1 Tax=Pectobacterium betavasculorum TaxID=55207 RepID=UPI00313C9557
MKPEGLHNPKKRNGYGFTSSAHHTSRMISFDKVAAASRMYANVNIQAVHNSASRMFTNVGVQAFIKIGVNLILFDTVHLRQFTAKPYTDWRTA